MADIENRNAVTANQIATFAQNRKCILNRCLQKRIGVDVFSIYMYINGNYSHAMLMPFCNNVFRKQALHSEVTTNIEIAYQSLVMISFVPSVTLDRDGVCAPIINMPESHLGNREGRA